MTNIQNTHPRKYVKGSRKCCVCASHHGLIRKYHMMMCRQCFREKATDIGFQKVICVPCAIIAPQGTRLPRCFKNRVEMPTTRV